jgi:hypothetical protein
MVAKCWQDHVKAPSSEKISALSIARTYLTLLTQSEKWYNIAVIQDKYIHQNDRRSVGNNQEKDT